MALSSDALAMRSRAAADEWRRGPVGEGGLGQAVVKVVSRGRKSRSGVAALVRYVERSSEEFARQGRKPLTLVDEAGDVVESGAAALKGWGLAADLDNLSPGARRALEVSGPEAVRLMDERDRLRHVQGWHIIFGVPSGRGPESSGHDGGIDVERMVRLDAALRGTVREAFGERGHRTLSAIHDDGAQLHGHVVVQALSSRGRRLRFDKQGDAVDSLREIFVRHARSCGLSVTAERRVDRREVLARVLAGKEPLRASRSETQVRRGSRVPAVVTPHWYLREGEGYEKRAPGFDAALAARGRRPPAGAGAAPARKRVPRNLPSELVPLYERMAECFADPARALDSWWRMATEGAHRRRDDGARGSGRVVWEMPNLAYAKWFLRKRPVAFGDVLPGAFGLAGDRAFQQLLRKVRPPMRADVQRQQAGQRGGLDAEVLGAALRRSQSARSQRRQRRERVRAAWQLERLAGQVVQQLGPGTDRARRILDAARRIEIPAEGPAVPPPLLPAVVVDAAKGIGERLAEVARSLRPRGRGKGRE
jgi:hypothetical protein